MTHSICFACTFLCGMVVLFARKLALYSACFFYQDGLQGFCVNQALPTTSFTLHGRKPCRAFIHIRKWIITGRTLGLSLQLHLLDFCLRYRSFQSHIPLSVQFLCPGIIEESSFIFPRNMKIQPVIRSTIKMNLRV